MPAKNKPKRLDRQKSWRVARRKRKIAELATPNKRTRPKRPKKKTITTETKPAQTKTVKKTVKKVEKKE